MSATSKGLDPITSEVIRNYYISSANQMRSILLRASFNPIIYEMIDFSVGLYNGKAELLAEGQAFPFFCGTLTGRRYARADRGLRIRRKESGRAGEEVRQGNGGGVDRSLPRPRRADRAQGFGGGALRR